MAYKESLYDRLTSALAPLYRKMVDVNLEYMGTQTDVLKISSTSENLLGDTSLTYTSSVVSNVIINYPFNVVDALNASDTGNLAAISITELLPIKMIIPSSNFSDQENDFDRDDIIIDIIKSVKGKNLYLVLTAPRAASHILGKHEILRVYELTLLRGTLETAIQDKIDEYMASFAIPTVVSTTPVSGTISVDLGASLYLNFNTPVRIMSMKDAISFSPVLDVQDLNFVQNTTSGIIIELSGVISPSTTYTYTISNKVPISQNNFSLVSDYTSNFTTI